jgi:hypothetical protein
MADEPKPHIVVSPPWADVDTSTLAQQVAQAAADIERAQLLGRIAAEIQRVTPVYVDSPESLRDDLSQATNDIPELRTRLAALSAVELPE